MTWRKSTHSIADGECVEVDVIQRDSRESTASDVTWRKSSKSGGGDCVEVDAVTQPDHGYVAIRDSKNPDAPYIYLESQAFKTLINYVKGINA